MINKAGLLAFPVIVLLLFIALPQPAAADQAGFDLPQPNGCYPVGTRTDVLKDVRRSRDLLVTFWYPAAEGTATHTPYLDKKTADALAEDWNLQPDFQRLVRAHAILAAPIAGGALFRLFYWNMAWVWCLASTRFWLRVWRAMDSLWSPRIIPERL